jgi:Cu2+-containing amine oxidase
MKIKLTESKLKQIVAESVNKVISESRRPNEKLSESSIDLDENYGMQNNQPQKENLQLIAQQFQTIESIVRNMRKQFDMAMRNGRPLNQMSSWIEGPKMIQSAIMQIISNMQM